MNLEPRLGDLILTKPSKTGAAKPTEGVTFLGMEDVSEDGGILATHIMPLSNIKKGLTYFEKDDVLVAKITPCFENGKGANLEFLKTKRGYGSTEFHVLRAKRDASAKYIFYHTQSVAFRKMLEGEMVGTAGQKRVPLAAIMKYPLPLAHSFIEQQAIAEALGEMDALLAAQRVRLAKQRAVKQGLLQGLLSGEKRLPGFAGEWEVKRLGDIATIWTGNTPPTADKSNYGDEYLFAGPSDLNDSKYIVDTEKKLSRKGFSISRKFPVGSTLFTCIGIIGKTALTKLELTSNQQINAAYPNSNATNQEYLYYSLTHLAPVVRLSATQQVLPLISKSQFSQLTILRPTIEEQRAIVAILTEADAHLAALEAEHAKTQLLKQGMMQNLLTGKIRLV